MRGLQSAALLTSLAMARIAHSEVIAEVRVDANDDDRLDRIQLFGSEIVGEFGGERADASWFRHPLPFTVTAGTLTSARGHGGIDVVASMLTAHGPQATALHITGGTAQHVWTGPVGPVGVDGEYQVVVEATARGLVRSQRRPDVFRCDGAPARLFSEGWHAPSRSWRPTRSWVDTAPASPLAVVPGAAPGGRSLVFSPVATSSAEHASHAGELSPPTQLTDGDPDTAWRAGRSGDGVGEFVTYQARLRGASASALWISAARPHPGSNLPARLFIVGEHAAYQVTLPGASQHSGGRGYLVEFPVPITDCVSVIIGAVHPGDSTAPGRGTTEIAELMVLSSLDQAAGIPELVTLTESGVARDRDVAEHVTALGQGAIAALAAAASAGGDHAARQRLLSALLHIDHEIAASAVAAALLRRDLPAADLSPALTLLARYPQVSASVFHQLIVDGARTVDERRRVVTALGRLPGPIAIPALVQLSQIQLPRAVSAALAPTLALHRARDLLSELSGAPRSATATLLRALTLQAIAHPDDIEIHQTVSALLLAALPHADSYPLQVRAAQGLAALGTLEQQHELVRWLSALPAGSTSDGVHDAVARAITDHRGPVHLALWRLLLDHMSPGVRVAAIRALARSTAAIAGAPPWTPASPQVTAGALERVLISTLRTDRWSEVRRAAAIALGGRCDHHGAIAALRTTIAADRHPGVRSDALDAFAACRPADLGAVLIALAGGEGPLPVRIRAIDLVATSRAPRLTAQLIRLFEQWRSAAFDDERAIQLVQAAAVALGRTRDPAVASALVDALADDAIPEIAAAAATGLGELREACPEVARQALQDLSSHQQRIVALAARRALRHCRP
jgi:hypothetical protein